MELVLGEATLPAYRAAFWEEADVLTFAYETLRDLRTLAGRVTIHELLTEALERTGDPPPCSPACPMARGGAAMSKSCWTKRARAARRRSGRSRSIWRSARD